MCHGERQRCATCSIRCTGRLLSIRTTSRGSCFGRLALFGTSALCLLQRSESVCIRGVTSSTGSPTMDVRRLKTGRSIIRISQRYYKTIDHTYHCARLGKRSANVESYRARTVSNCRCRFVDTTLLRLDIDTRVSGCHIHHWQVETASSPIFMCHDKFSMRQ